MLKLVIFFTLIPDVGVKFATFGFHWTAYRLIMFFATLYILLSQHFVLRFRKKGYLKKWSIFMLIWVLYGCVLMYTTGYSDIHKGLIELLSIFNGFIIIYIFINSELSNVFSEKTINLLYWIITFFVIVGLIEIVTGLHWRASAFNDLGSTIAMYDNHHLATGFMYNMNDFSALLSCFSPILIYKKLGYKRWITLVGIVIINFINDASTCSLSMIIYFTYVLLLEKGKNEKVTIFKRVFFGALCIFIITFIFINIESLVGRNDLIGAISRQIYYARRQSGSLFRRLKIYEDSILVWFNGHILGMGPSSFTNYFTEHPSTSLLVNPHSLLLEILTQYGIIIFLGFLVLLSKMTLKAVKKYRIADEENRILFLIVIGFAVNYIISSFAPSTFLGYAYQWLLIGLIACQLDKSNNEGVKTIKSDISENSMYNVSLE